MSFDDIMSGIRRLRTSIRTSTGRSEAVPRDTIRLLGQNLAAKLQSGNQAQNQYQQIQASRNPINNPTPNMGALQPQNLDTSRPRTRLLNLGMGFLQRPPPQAPPTEEEKRRMAEEQKRRDLEAKKKLARERQYRLDNMRGLSVDRT